MMLNLKRFFYEYGTIIFFAIGLTSLVIASYILSRLIPTSVFIGTISPLLHVALFLATLIGAILMHWHTHGRRARQMWQVVLIIWSIAEGVMLIVENVFDYPVLIFGTGKLELQSMVARDLLACVLVFCPTEVLFPKWLNWWKMLGFMLPPFLIWGLNYVTETDLSSLLMAYPLLLSIYLLTNIQNYRKWCEDNYSSLENTAIRFLRGYIVTLVVIGLSYSYQCISDHPTRFFTQQWLVLFLFVMTTAQFVFRRQQWQEETAEDEGEGPEPEMTFPPEYRAAFEAWMEKEKPYLNKDFRVSDLMTVLPLNRTYLSQFLKAEYDCSFYQVVTTYRIREAQRLLLAHPDMKIAEVADRSGFASPMVFNRSFKRETDLTPTEWLQKSATE